MQGSGYEGPRLCGASIESVSAGFFHPDVSQVSRAVARGSVDDRSPDHYQYSRDGALSRKGACLLVSSGVLAATLVLMGHSSSGGGCSVHLCGATGALV